MSPEGWWGEAPGSQVPRAWGRAMWEHLLLEVSETGSPPRAEAAA